MAWYNYDRAMSYNALFTFILTNRGLGKTYGAKKRVVKKFLKKGEQFIYLRRYKEELKTVSTFWDDISKDPEFEGVEFKVVHKQFYINGKVAGYAIPLSVSQNYKSTPYPDVTTIIFDEFIINTQNLRYLKNEVSTYLDFFETVARKRDNVRAIFLANNISFVNPYFQYFRCIPKPGNRFTLAKDGEVLVEVFKDDEFNEEKYQTKFGKLIKNTAYGNYAIENESLRDDSTFINKNKPKDSIFCFSIINNGIELGYWVSFKEDKFYVCKDIQPNSTMRFSINKDEHDMNYTMITSLRNFSLFIEFVKFYTISQVEFVDIEVKQECYDIMRLLGIR